MLEQTLLASHKMLYKHYILWISVRGRWSHSNQIIFKALSTDNSFHFKIGVCYQKLSTLEFNFHYQLSIHCERFNTSLFTHSQLTKQNRVWGREILFLQVKISNCSSSYCSEGMKKVKGTFDVHAFCLEMLKHCHLNIYFGGGCHGSLVPRPHPLHNSPRPGSDH